MIRRARSRLPNTLEEVPLDAVHIASHENPRGVRLNLPKDMTIAQAREAIKREALRWTYLLRSRKR